VMPYGLVDGYRRFVGVYCFNPRRQRSYIALGTPNPLSRKASRGFRRLCFGNYDGLAH
jgi:hypothetical protein